MIHDMKTITMSSTLATRKTTLEKSINFQKIQKLKIQNVSMFKKCNFFPHKYKNFLKLQVFFLSHFLRAFYIESHLLTFCHQSAKIGRMEFANDKMHYVVVRRRTFNKRRLWSILAMRESQCQNFRSYCNTS